MSEHNENTVTSLQVQEMVDRRVKEILETQLLGAMLDLTTNEQKPNLNRLILILRDIDAMKINIKNYGYTLAREMQKNLKRSGRTVSPHKVDLKSKLSTQQDIESEWVLYWCSKLNIEPMYHRKIWELCYVPQAIYDAIDMNQQLHGIGFGCGEEPLPSLFASMGHTITVTDLEPEKVKGLGWAETGQHTNSLDKAYFANIVTKELFYNKVGLLYVDMNSIPSDLYGKYDYCWSVCALEHLGSIQNGLNFIINSLNVLKPGGVAVHTTEFNYTNSGKTIDNWPTVIFNQNHFRWLENELKNRGYTVKEFDFNPGSNVLDRFIDIPPYGFGEGWISKEMFGDINQAAHMKLSIDGFPCTCIGIIIYKHKMETTNMLDSNISSTTTLTSSPPIIWLDITDLLVFVQNNTKVTGIQRVQVGIISNILFNKDIPLQFKFCAMKANDLAFYEIAAFNLKTLVNALAEISTIEFTKWQQLIHWLTASENNLPPVQFNTTDCLLILGCFWAYPRQAQRILQVKREFGVKIIQMIHDLIPILRSEIVSQGLAMEFSLGMYAVIAYTDGFLTNSKFTAAEVLEYIKQQNNPPPPSQILPFLIGTELTCLKNDENIQLENISTEVQKVVEKPFVLLVSTLEIRKNHIYIFQIWQQLIQQYNTDTIPNLIFVGRRGWMVDDLFTQLDSTKNLGGKVFIFGNISDSELKMLYENCLFTVYPSTYEGFGSPVAESLNYGKVCVASNVTSIPEAGGDLAIYIDPYNLNSGYQAIEELLFNPTTLKERESLIRNTYRPVSWKMATESLIDSIQHILASISDVPVVQEPAIANLLPVPVAKLNKKYLFSKKSNYSQNEQYANNAFCSQVLQKKWHQVEEYHIWSEGKTALLAFALPKPEISDILICYIEFNLPNYFDKQQVTVKLNQQHFSTWTIPPGQIIHKILKFNTAQAFEISNGNIVFTLHIELDHITDPKEKNIADTRILGIGMRSLTLIDGTDLLQRVQVLENLLEIR